MENAHAAPVRDGRGVRTARLTMLSFPSLHPMSGRLLVLT